MHALQTRHEALNPYLQPGVQPAPAARPREVPARPVLSAARHTVLLATRDARMREHMRPVLEGDGWNTRSVDVGARVVAACAAEPVDLVILGDDLIDVSALDLCRILRGGAHPPLVLMLVNGGESARELALEAGADDCVSRPCATRELFLRIGALRRHIHRPRGAQRQMQVGRIRIDVDMHRVEIDGMPVSVTLTEFRILQHLALADGEALSRTQLRERIWGVGTAVTERVVDTHIRRLRARLDSARDHVETVHGAGYRLRR